MKTLNLNIAHWSMLDIKADRDHLPESQFFNQDIVSTLEDISPANINDVFCDFNDHEYIT